MKRPAPKIKRITPNAVLAKEKAKANREKWISLFRTQAREAQLPGWVEEYRFAAACVGWKLDLDPRERAKTQHGLRRMLVAEGLKDWRFDVAWPDLRIAAELDGGVWHGRHVRPEGFMDDADKINAAQARGWVVFRFPGPRVQDGSGVRLLAQVLRGGAFRPLAAGTLEDALPGPAKSADLRRLEWYP